MDVGFSEILVIILAIVVLFGPDKLPQIARDLGHAVRKMRGAVDEIKDEILKETDNPVSEIKREIDKVKTQARQFDPLADVKKDMEFKQYVENAAKLPQKIDPEDDAHEGPVSR